MEADGMKAERLMVFACVLGMILCVALAARADEPVASITTAGEITVVVTPEPTFRERAESAGWHIPTADEAAFCTGWFVAPVAFSAANYPFYRALEHNSSVWRGLAPDKQDHFVWSAYSAGIFASVVYSVPANAARGWKPAAGIGAACLGIGLAKEAADEYGYRLGQRDRGAEAGDLLADAAGCAAGTAAGAAIGTGVRITAGAIAGGSGAQVGVSVPF